MGLLVPFLTQKSNPSLIGGATSTTLLSVPCLMRSISRSNSSLDISSKLIGADLCGLGAGV
jgi:hypothetical protein